jgi:hypothetical protein
MRCQFTGADRPTHDNFIHTYALAFDMRKIPKTITLDEQTAIIAERIGNFSGWVRQKLRTHAMIEARDAAHVAPEQGRVHGETKDKCNPRHKSGKCAVCWGSE